jgi:phosphoglycolate phosphatase-like HAD superfamily hydrolase
MLVLFDIDGTLLLSHGAGTRSMLAAARELFGESVTLDGVEIAGCIDPLIWMEVARANGLPDAGAHHDRFRETYHRHLAERLAAGHRVELLPGVRELLDALRASDDVTLGLLTGNYPETGGLKMRAAGLDPALFVVARNVVVVGDTPHDVACARAHGCRCLAVATGTFSREKLAGCEPDLLVDDLTGTEAILDWILQVDPVQ